MNLVVAAPRIMPDLTIASRPTTAPASTCSAPQTRSVTLRVVVLILLIAALFGYLMPVIDYKISNTSLGATHLPPGAIGVLLILIGVINPLLRLLAKKWAFSRDESLTVYIACLFSSLVPGHGAETFIIPNLLTPFYYATRENKWLDWLQPYLKPWLTPALNADRNVNEKVVSQLSSQVAFSLWFGFWFIKLQYMAAYYLGWMPTTLPNSDISYGKAFTAFQIQGAYWMYVALVLWTGREHLLYVFKRAIGRVVTMTLLELGKSAQEKATAHLLQNLTKNSEGTASNIPHPDLLALAWLGSDDDWQQAKQILGAKWQRSGSFLERLRTAAHATNEGAALNALLDEFLSEPGDLQLEKLGWPVFRLGDLANARAVPTPTKFLRKYGTYDDYSVSKALTNIGQKDAQNEAIVVEAMMSVLTLPDENRVGGQAVQIISILQGARARPLLRRIVRGEDSGPKMEAMGALSRVGTPEDLPLLLPLADFWTAPRGLQYWAVDAVTNLRGRFNLDVGAAPKS